MSGSAPVGLRSLRSLAARADRATRGRSAAAIGALATIAALALAPRAHGQEVVSAPSEAALGEGVTDGPSETSPENRPSIEDVLPSEVEPTEVGLDEGRARTEPAEPSEPRLEWDEEWTKIGVSHVISASIAGGIVLASRILGPVPEPWVEFNDFDETFRDGLRLPTEGSRRLIRDISDVGLTIAVAYPILVDAILLAAYVHENPEVAAQIAMIAVETYAVVSAMWGVANISLSRERPYGRTCGGELHADSYACDDNRRFYSSFSGHAALTMTSAALTCVTHANMPLLPDALGLVPCLGGIGLSLATGLMRIAGDQHYATDVLGGWGIGALVGFLLPTILHYRGGIIPTGSARVRMRVTAGSDGVALEGSF